jgi:DNA invertase Pin-like site-specific DNA recombinase
MNDKVRSDHRSRAAYIYVRQSSPYQVRHHLEGQQRQYDLAHRARELGFAQVKVIDEDLGRSGSGSVERAGFGKLLAAVCDGFAGAVFALEASRLARNNRDWHHLIDLCALTDTLLIDEDGVYDPRQLNDRLLLGLKGTMSEFELGLFRQRARLAFEQKVKKGYAMWELPVGFVRTEDCRIEKTPDRQVQQAIEGVFGKFRELGSARQALLWYREEQIPLPLVQPGTAGREIIWRLPTGHRILQFLKNPCYAGALAYGRTGAKTVLEGSGAKKTRRHRRPFDQWGTLIQDNHPGYITWDQYLENQRALEENLAIRGGDNTGAAKEGAALLAGLLRCGRCGRMLHVLYSGNHGQVPRYACKGGRVDRGSAPCHSAGSLRLDRAIVDTVLEAIQPAGIEAALAARHLLLREEDQKQKALALALEKARYEAGRARRQYDAVDPENRLVAGELETRWNDALSQVAGLESRLEAARPTPLTEEQEQRLLELGSDLDLLWNHPRSPVSLKKRILRTVLNEIIITTNDEPPEHILKLHWAGGVHTELRLRRNGTGQHRRTVDRKVIVLIEELAKVCSDQQIAAVLNRLGYRTGQGNTWRASRVASLRYSHQIPVFGKREGWLTMEQTANELQVSDTVIKRLIREGTLPATQVVHCAPWVIDRKDLESPRVQAAIKAVRKGRRLPSTPLGQSELPLK